MIYKCSLKIEILIQLLLMVSLLTHAHFCVAQTTELDTIQNQLNNPKEIDQFSGNEAEVLQIIDQATVTGNIAEITQDFENTLEVSQLSFPTANELMVVQGSLNTAELTQTVLGTGFNLAEILQGNDNLIRLFQESRDSNSAVIRQQGDGNILVGADPEDAAINSAKQAVQTSVEGSNSLQLIQEGDDNAVGLTQEGFGNNVANLTQLGSGNQFGVYQTSILSGFENRIEITQEGGSIQSIETSTLPTESGGVLDYTSIPSLVRTP